MARRAYLPLLLLLALLFLAALSSAAHAPGAGAPAAVRWSVLPRAGDLRPFHVGFALPSEATGFRLTGATALNVTVRHEGNTIFQSAHVGELDGLGRFTLHPLPGTIEVSAEGPNGGSAISTIEPHLHHSHDAGDKLNGRFVFEGGGRVLVDKQFGGYRMFVEFFDKSGRLLLGTWTTGNTDTIRTGPDFFIDPSIPDLRGRVIHFGRLGLKSWETPFPASQTTASPVPVPSLNDLDAPNLGCEDVFRIDPPSANQTWQRGTTLQVSLADATSFARNYEVPIEFTVERRLSQGGRAVYSWETFDPWGTSYVAMPSAGVYSILATQAGSGVQTRRCQEIVTIVDGPTATGQLRIGLEPGAAATPKELRTNRTGTLNVTLAPSVTGHPYAYEVRVTEHGSAIDVSEHRLVWAGKLYAPDGVAKFHLGGLMARQYRVYAYAIPQSPEAPSLVSGPTGFQAAVDLARWVPEAPATPTPTETPTKRTPAPSAVPFLLLLGVALWLARRD